MQTTTAAIDTGVPRVSGGKRTFLRHFGEMLLAMFLGMALLGGATQAGFAAAGSSVSNAPGAVRVLLMGLAMTVPMVAWMSARGHDSARTFEMAGSMIVPTLVAAALAVGEVLGTGGALALQHAVMIPAMLGVMLWRYDHYAHS